MFRSLVAYLEERRVAKVKLHVAGYLLDVGCGPNRLVQEHGHGVGLDVHNWGVPGMVMGHGAWLPFKEGSFDTITFVASLNHIPHREQALRDAWRVLRPGGTILITMIGPRVSLVWHKLVRKSDPDQQERGHFDPGEVWGIGVTDMKALIRGAGFRFVQRKTFILGQNSLYIGRKEPE